MERKKSPKVYQANPLIEARKPMNALEMRLFLLAVAAVNPHLSEKDKYYDHEFKELHLKPGELKAIFGNGSYLTRLEEVCDGLMERTIKLRDGKGGFVIYTVFDVIRYKPKDGLRIQFNHNMRPFLLDIYESRKGYTRIGLKQIFQLSSAYAIRLLELMLQYRGTMQGKKIVRHIEVDDLRFLLNVDEAKYKLMAEFKRRVLDAPIREINQRTQYQLSYEPTKTGRKITGFTFTMDCSHVTPDAVVKETITLERALPKREWHGLSEQAINKLTTLCGSNAEFKKRMTMHWSWRGSGRSRIYRRSSTRRLSRITASAMRRSVRRWSARCRRRLTMRPGSRMRCGCSAMPSLSMSRKCHLTLRRRWDAPASASSRTSCRNAGSPSLAGAS